MFGSNRLLRNSAPFVKAALKGKSEKPNGMPAFPLRCFAASARQVAGMTMFFIGNPLSKRTVTPAKAGAPFSFFGISASKTATKLKTVSQRPIKAFTLVEMSLVLIVIGLVILIVFPAMKALRDGTQRQLTHSNLSTLSRAIAAFVQANGCLPCPTPASAVGAGFGSVRGASGGAACGACAVPEGIAPFASLGLPAATAKDGWGRWITMRIDPALALNEKNIVPPTAPCTASDPAPCALGASQKGLCRANIPNANRISIRTSADMTQTAAFVLASHGPNGYGAFTTSMVAGGADGLHNYNGPAGTCTVSSGYERCNADGDLSFVDTMATTNPTDPFDDVLVYMDRNALVASLGQGACQTTW